MPDHAWPGEVQWLNNGRWTRMHTKERPQVQVDTGSNVYGFNTTMAKSLTKLEGARHWNKLNATWWRQAYAHREATAGSSCGWRNGKLYSMADPPAQASFTREPNSIHHTTSGNINPRCLGRIMINICEKKYTWNHGKRNRHEMLWMQRL